MLRLVVEDEPPGPPAVPSQGECLVCFVERMVLAYGCGHGLPFTRLWRNRAAPRASALERRLRAKGGCCDCEVLLNVFVRLSVYAQEVAWKSDKGLQTPATPCAGVSRGSAQPCDQWMARRRRRRW